MNHLINKNLYTDLMTLVQNNEAFYSQDFVGPNGRNYRIFNYRLASYTDFLEPGAIHCRGTMFDITYPDDVTLQSLPMEKFWNLNENPFTMGLDLSTVRFFDVKADGSLISTYGDFNGQHTNVLLKSKGSLSSEQAIDAMAFMNKDPVLVQKLTHYVAQGITVNMEWCAPFNRVVLGYPQAQLLVLNARNNYTGEYICHSELRGVFSDYIVDRTIAADPEEFIASIQDTVGIEGYILEFDSGQKVKIKTHWYMTQHRAKDSINSDRRLFETVVADAHDDLRSLFHDDQMVLDRIDWMEELVVHEYNRMVSVVEVFYEDNKHLDRKDYAIKAKNEVKPLWFGLCMNLYLGKHNDYKAFMMKQYKHYGIKDQQKEEL